MATIISYGLAFDVDVNVPKDAFTCLKKSHNYAVAFIRMYKPNHGGQIDENANENILNAVKGMHSLQIKQEVMQAILAKIGVELYVQPNSTFPENNSATKSADRQFDEVMSDLRAHHISIGTIWLMVCLLIMTHVCNPSWWITG